MKLTKMQITVLAQEIYSELETESNKYKESPEYINFEDTLKDDERYKGLKKVGKAVQEAVDKNYLSDNYHARRLQSELAEYVDSKRNKAFPSTKRDLPSFSQIENKIILNTIDVDNLDELINKVKEIFKK